MLLFPLKAIKNEGERTIAIEAWAADLLLFLGSSVFTSATTTSQKLPSLTVCVPDKETEDRVHVIAACEYNYKRGVSRSSLFRLNVHKNGTFHIDDKRPFIPAQDRLLQINDRNYLYLKTPDKTYSTDPDSEFHVPDGNLLCQYATGKIEIIKLEQAVERQQQKQDLKAELELANSTINTLETLLARWKYTALNLKEATTVPYFKGRWNRIQEVIEDFPRDNEA